MDCGNHLLLTRLRRFRVFLVFDLFDLLRSVVR